jgi:hypothetical protein
MSNESGKTNRSMLAGAAGEFSIGGMIAGIVVARHATLATRNVIHFEP